MNHIAFHKYLALKAMQKCMQACKSRRNCTSYNQGKSIEFLKTLEKDDDPDLVVIGTPAVKLPEGTDPAVCSQ